MVDIRMPPTFTDEGVVAAHEIRRHHPTVATMLLSQHVYAGRVLDLLTETSSSGFGYLLKDRVTEIDDFLDALRRVTRGAAVLDPLVIAALLRTRHQTTALDRLSPREADVLALMAQGRTNAAIARQIHIGTKTVEGYVNAIFTKLDLHTAPDDNRRVLAVLTWLRSAT